MPFDNAERSLLAALADLLIPAEKGGLSATEAGVSEMGLDQVLTVRPELKHGLKEILRRAQGRAAPEMLAELRTRDMAAFAILTEVAAGAYFLNPKVRASLGYSGQSARPIDGKPDYLEDALLQSVINRGPIYRPSRR